MQAKGGVESNSCKILRLWKAMQAYIRCLHSMAKCTDVCTRTLLQVFIWLLPAKYVCMQTCGYQHPNIGLYNTCMWFLCRCQRRSLRNDFMAVARNEGGDPIHGPCMATVPQSPTSQLRNFVPSNCSTVVIKIAQLGIIHWCALLH